MTLDEIRAAYSDMTPGERREALPAWFPGHFDPSYPEWQTLYGDDEDTGVGELIAREMVIFEAALPPGRRQSKRDWLNHADAIEHLVEACRVIYFPAYHDWLERNAPEGSRWRPHRTLSKGDAEQVGPTYDYAGYAGQTAADVLKDLGYPTWTALHAADFQKGVKPGAERRPSKDGWVTHGLGIFEDRPVGTTPMSAIYELTKRFYMHELGMRAFRPEFPFANDEVAERRPLPEGRTERYVGEKLHVTMPSAARGAVIKRKDMNTAAKFLSLILKEVDRHFNARQAGLVARAFYKRT